MITRPLPLNPVEAKDSRTHTHGGSDGDFSRPIPLPFGNAHHPNNPGRTSHIVAILTVAVIAFLGAMQVIGTQAQGDSELLQELSEKVQVAEVSSAGVSGFSVESPLESALEPSETEPLTNREGLTIESIPAPEQQPTEKQQSDLEQSPEPSPESSPEAALIEDPQSEDPESPCTPDGAGAPYCLYVVQDGDTLSDIAVTLGVASTEAFSGAELIALSNGLDDAQNWLIVPGQELRVPVDSGVIHTVGESETISTLANLYGVLTADVIAANGLTDANTVVVGATLLIPSPSFWPYSGPAAAEAERLAVAPEDETTIAEETGEAATDETGDDATLSESGLEAPEEGSSPEGETAAEPTGASANANPSVAEIRDLFAEGYVAAGGPAQYIQHLLDTVIPCESGYNRRAYNPAGPFYGLMQFLPQTWENTGGGDWFDPWQQGHNTGVLLLTANPWTQWPVCWGAGP